jgi:hypothetical protein
MTGTSKVSKVATPALGLPFDNLVTYPECYSVEQSPSPEDVRSTIPEIPRLVELEGSLLFSRKLPTAHSLFL